MKIDETHIGTADNDWQRPIMSWTTSEFRRGWLGAWDAFKEALLKEDRPQSPHSYTMSIYHKATKDAEYIWGAQLESGVVSYVYEPSTGDSK